MKRTISTEIVQAQLAIENALNHVEIQKKLSAYNLDRKKLLEGKALCEEVNILQMVKQDQYGMQFQSTDALRADTEQIRKNYGRHLKIARLAFEDDRGIVEQLQLKGRRKTDKNGWLVQAYTFYNKIEIFAEEMNLYHVMPEELAQARAMVEAIYASRQQQLQKIGEAQNATHKRDEVRKELKSWMSRFRKTARLALQDEPQLLEILGIKVASQKA